MAGLQPDIIHVHEWQLSAVPMLYWDHYHKQGLTRPRVMLTIHNMDSAGECRQDEFAYSGRHSLGSVPMLCLCSSSSNIGRAAPIQICLIKTCCAGSWRPVGLARLRAEPLCFAVLSAPQSCTLHGAGSWLQVDLQHNVYLRVLLPWIWVLDVNEPHCSPMLETCHLLIRGCRAPRRDVCLARQSAGRADHRPQP